MAANPAYTVEQDGREFVIRVDGRVFSAAEVSRFLDFLTLESIRKKSELSEGDADGLAREVKSAAWERVRHLFPEE